jgi:hypothetical protein
MRSPFAFPLSPAFIFRIEGRLGLGPVPLALQSPFGLGSLTLYISSFPFRPCAACVNTPGDLGLSNKSKLIIPPAMDPKLCIDSEGDGDLSEKLLEAIPGRFSFECFPFSPGKPMSILNSLREQEGELE